MTNIADAIRAKGVTGTMNAYEMPTKIASIPSGGGAKYGVTLNGILGDLDSGFLQFPDETFNFTSSNITGIGD